MRIGEGGTGVYQSAGMTREDSVAANIRRQINEAKKQLQEVSADKNLTLQQKNEKKKQLTDTINDLNQQLQQHEMNKKQEQLKKMAEAAKQQREAARSSSQKEDNNASSLSKATVQAIAAAESNESIVTVKDGVRMNLSNEAMQLNNTIKREELEGGVSPLRKELEELYGEMGKLAGEVTGTLAASAQKLEKALQEGGNNRKEDAKDTGEVAENGAPIVQNTGEDQSREKNI